MLPQENFDFRRSETTSSAFSGIMNSIWGKVYYAYSQNNIQHILTCKSIMNRRGRRRHGNEATHYNNFLRHWHFSQMSTESRGKA